MHNRFLAYKCILQPGVDALSLWMYLLHFISTYASMKFSSCILQNVPIHLMHVLFSYVGALGGQTITVCQ